MFKILATVCSILMSFQALAASDQQPAFTVTCKVYNQSNSTNIKIEEPLSATLIHKEKLGDYNISLANIAGDKSSNITFQIKDKNDVLLYLTTLELNNYNPFSAHGFSVLRENTIFEYFCDGK